MQILHARQASKAAAEEAAGWGRAAASTNETGLRRVDLARGGLIYVEVRMMALRSFVDSHVRTRAVRWN